MAQEFTIKSESIESKINQLLPSQGGFGAGVDFSASTMVIPIVDLTETAEGSGLRQDLQTAISHNQATVFAVVGAKTTIINTTGYFRILGAALMQQDSGSPCDGNIIINDGTTDKIIWGMQTKGIGVSNGMMQGLNIDFNIFLGAGDSLIIESTNTQIEIVGSVRQIADISGNLVNPT